MPHPLFIYGTLHPDRAPAEIAAVARRLTSLGRATIAGRLYDLGDYPGVVLTEAGEVAGELYALPDAPDAEAVLQRFDAYEDFRPDDPANSLFLRQLAIARRTDGSEITCWIYSYNSAHHST